MSAHKHHYVRLSDTAVFCEGCGDIKGAEPCQLQHYPTTYPWIIYPWSPWPTWPYTVGNGTGDALPVTYPTVTSSDTVIGFTYTGDVS